MTEKAILEMAKEGNSELVPAKYVQTVEEIRDKRVYSTEANNCLKTLLDKLEILTEKTRD